MFEKALHVPILELLSSMILVQGVCNCSMYCCTLLYVHSSIAIILMGKRELIALLNLSSWCLVMVERLFLTVPRGCLQFVIVVFPDHTHLLFLRCFSVGNHLLSCLCMHLFMPISRRLWHMTSHGDLFSNSWSRPFHNCKPLMYSRLMT